MQRAAMARVRAYLGDAVVDAALLTPHLTPLKLIGIHGAFGPTGASERFWGDTGPPMRQAVLRIAVQRFANDAKEYDNRLFESYLSRALRDERNPPDHTAGADAGSLAGAARRTSPRAGPGSRAGQPAPPRRIRSLTDEGMDADAA